MRAGSALLIALVVIAAAGGCGSPTSIAFNVTLTGGAAQPDSLRVTLFGAGRDGVELVPLASAGKALPGTLVVSPVDAGEPGFRWLLEGLDPLGVVKSQAAAFAVLTPSAENPIDAALGAPLPDADGDGVPDVIDDCPQTPDPEQRCAAGNDSGTAPDGGFLCPANAILCEDFESGSFSTNGWTVSNLHTGDSVGIDGTRPHSGARSLDAVGVMMGQGHIAAIDHTLTLPASFAVREFLWLDSDPGADGFFLQVYSDTIGISLGESDSGDWKLVEDFNTSQTDHDSSVPLAFGTWTCLEFVVTVSGGAQRFQAWAGNQVIADFMPSEQYGFNDLYVGYARIPPGGATELYVDDVTVTPARLGCP
jgi:hypothetical protein